MKSIALPGVTGILLGIVVFLFGCNSEIVDPVSEDRMFLFGIKNDPQGKEDFVALTSDSLVIAAISGQLAKPFGERTLHINGTIEDGNEGYNLDWNWHFTPNEWSLVEISIEVCDGLPSNVEQDLDYWVNNIGRFCPWSSIVKSEITKNGL